MDGTLIEPMIDFDALRREMDIPPGEGVLESMDEMPPAEKKAAYERLESLEMDAAKRAGLMEGADEIIRSLRLEGIRTALLTRNTRSSVDIVSSRFDCFSFELVQCRDEGAKKPSPSSILGLCSRMGVDPQHTLCVGDYVYDIMAANSAGATSVLITTSSRWREFADQADHVIETLVELKAIIGIR
jgi:HAD superfamily hydrolase (TIGR01549 family)